MLPEIGNFALVLALVLAIIQGSLPMPGLFQCLGNLGRHVILVMFGQHLPGNENPFGVERAFGHNTLPFAEQIGQQVTIKHRHLGAEIGDDKAGGEAVGQFLNMTRITCRPRLPRH